MAADAKAPPTYSYAMPAGRRVAGYRLTTLLGRGRRSVVYVGESATTGERVAVKLATQPQWTPDGAEPDFRGEYRRLQSAAHRNVLRALAEGVEGGMPYLVTELAEGGALHAPAGGAEPHMVISWACDAAAALAHIHPETVHRDVKPGNLLLRADGSVALADFGSSGPASRANRFPAGTVIGTPVYAAPEQSLGREADPRADVYSLGVVLFEWLTGTPPFPGRTATELLGQHMVAPVPALPSPLQAWQPLVHAMLAKEPYDRPAGGAELLERLRREAASLVPPTGASATGGQQNRT